MKHKTIQIQGKDIAIDTSITGDDYISLTDIARFKNYESTGFVIIKWLSVKYTIRFIGLWEKIHNPDFNVTEFGNIKNEAGDHDYMLSVSKWIKTTNAIGIRSSPGRYGGTFAPQRHSF